MESELISGSLHCNNCITVYANRIMKYPVLLSISTIVFAGLVLADCTADSNDIHAKKYSGITSNYKANGETETATAQKETNSDFQKFIRKAYRELDQNETAILKLQIKSGNIIIDSISRLSIANDNLRQKLNDYVEFGNGNWKLFQIEFCTSLDDLNITKNASFVSIK
jgi:hypothetical protein